MPLSKAMTPYRARFHEVHVGKDESGRLLLHCVVENVSAVGWAEHEAASLAGEPPAASPVFLGYRVFDAETGLLVMDGSRANLGAECLPQARRKVSAELQLPLEEGRYRIVISPVHEQVAWFYERGSEYVEVEVDSTARGVEVGRIRRMTGARRRGQRVAQILFRFLWYPVRMMARHRALILAMVRRDLLGRYRGSMGGALWTLAHPLLLMIAYAFVFGVVLQVRFGGAPGSGGFVFYFLCGMLPWLAFSEALGRSPQVVFEHSNFVKRVVFPLEILPVNLTLVGLLTEILALLLLLVALIAVGPGLHWPVLYLPAVVVPQLLLTAGLCWFLAALGVFLRDTGQIMGFLLTLWFFMTPICYPATALPQAWLWLFEQNPMYTIVGAYRAVFLENSPPEWHRLGSLWALSLAAFWLGFAWFYKVKKSFADLL